MPILTALRRFLSHYWVTSNTIRYRIELRSILRCLESIPISERKGTLVDLGAGSGEMSRRLFQFGKWNQLIGIEPDPNNFSLLQKNWGNLTFSQTIQGSLLDIPLPRDSVDFVLSTQVLEHIENDHLALSEIVRILKPGGYAMIGVPHPPEIFPIEGHVRQGYTEYDLKKILEEFKMKFIESDYFFTIPTNKRMTALEVFPLLKFLYWNQWVDQEASMSKDQKLKLQPYGICVIAQKNL